MQGNRGLTAGLRSVDLDDPATWESTNAQGDVERDRSSGDCRNLDCFAFPQSHDRTLAMLLLNLAESSLERLFPIRRSYHP